MGVDPGLTRCGVGVVEGGLGSPLKLIAVGVIRTPADLDHAHRLLRIHDGLEEWRDHTRPDAIAVEKVFAQHNRNTVAGTAQAAGMAMMIAARHGLPVALHTPSEVKAAISGSGRADKARWVSWWHGCYGSRLLPSLLMLPTLSPWRSATCGVAGRLVALKPLWLRNDAVGVCPVLGRT
ncbi:crossover junction endodeoxyribonuclease RuvC [Cutibacterium acnes JCM 18909]|nr:crossover junction endodeoxyribonuclease RuvC [Cutibacterium acnes JCM 18909]